MNISDPNPKVHPSSFSAGRNVGRFQVFPGGGEYGNRGSGALVQRQLLNKWA